MEPLRALGSPMNRSCAAEPGSITGLHQTAMKWSQAAVRLPMLLSRPSSKRGGGGVNEKPCLEEWLADEDKRDERLRKTMKGADLLGSGLLRIM